MKSIMITAPNSGSGKTTITMGLIRALKNKGKNVSCFKTGPDYIDTAFLGVASRAAAGNLDMHLQGKQGMRKAFAFGTGDLCIIEGAMGYFDGMYNTFENSSYDIANTLGVAAILIYTPKGEMFSAVPKIKGMATFENANIKGVILNKVNAHYYELLKAQIEKYTSVKVLGFIPDMQDVSIESRHLGLVQSVEMQDIDQKIERMAQVVTENIALDTLIEMMQEVEKEALPIYEKRDITVAIAKDKAFSFYYRENIKMLESTCEVVYFSPLTDKSLPPCDIIYLGGGYPEVFAKQLSENTGMLLDIQKFAQAGGCIYAECGGFMYLTEKIEGYKMVGVFEGKSRLTHKLQRFGYIDITLKQECILGAAGERLTAHEFHKSVSEVAGKEVFEIQKTMGMRTWACGYRYKNVLAGYPHIHFLGNESVFKSIINHVERSKKICKEF